MIDFAVHLVVSLCLMIWEMLLSCALSAREFMPGARLVWDVIYFWQQREGGIFYDYIYLHHAADLDPSLAFVWWCSVVCTEFYVVVLVKMGV